DRERFLLRAPVGGDPVLDGGGDPLAGVVLAVDLDLESHRARVHQALGAFDPHNPGLDVRGIDGDARAPAGHATGAGGEVVHPRVIRTHEHAVEDGAFAERTAGV